MTGRDNKERKGHFALVEVTRDLNQCVPFFTGRHDGWSWCNLVHHSFIISYTLPEFYTHEFYMPTTLNVIKSTAAVVNICY